LKGDACELTDPIGCDANLNYTCGESLTLTSEYENNEYGNSGDMKCFSKDDCGDQIAFNGTNYWFTCEGKSGWDCTS